MRKLLICWMILWMLTVPALAEETDPAAAWFDRQYDEMVPAGIEALRTEKAYPLELGEEKAALSLCLTAEGDLRFGRYAQLVRTGLVDAETGEALALDAVFADVDALQAFLDEYVEENVLDALNTYLDANDLLPVPLDAVCFDAQGVTFHYPMERFQYFSGHAGAVQLQWYELREQLRLDPPEQPFPLLPGQAIDQCLETYGSLTDPDLVAGGELYEFEAPALRDVQAVADENGRITAVRAARFSVRGAVPGMTKAEAAALLGEAENVFPLEAGAAAGLRLRPGEAAWYPWQEGEILTLYFDADGLAYLAEVSLR